jgi:hypothetical protein
MAPPDAEPSQPSREEAGGQPPYAVGQRVFLAVRIPGFTTHSLVEGEIIALVRRKGRLYYVLSFELRGHEYLVVRPADQVSDDPDAPIQPYGGYD